MKAFLKWLRHLVFGGPGHPAPEYSEPDALERAYQGCFQRLNETQIKYATTKNIRLSAAHWLKILNATEEYFDVRTDGAIGRSDELNEATVALRDNLHGVAYPLIIPKLHPYDPLDDGQTAFWAKMNAYNDAVKELIKTTPHADEDKPDWDEELQSTLQKSATSP